VDLAGERQVLTSTSWDILGLSLATGKKLWSVRVEGSEQHSTAVVYGDCIIFADYKDRPRAIRLERGASGITPREVWKGDGPAPYMSSPIIEGNLVFGSSVRGRGCFFCLDARSGKTLWQSDEREGFGYATVLNARSVLLFLTVRGRLVVVKPDGEKYQPIVEYQVSDRQTWAHPVFLGDRILIRDDLTLRSFRIEAAASKE
jgi:outer membrane protein assembly factor BamB